MPSPAELRNHISSQIIAALESGSLPPWRKPWLNDNAAGHPTNAVSKLPYRGVNPLLLNLSAMQRGFQSKYWATFAQWNKLDGRIRKGEKATRVIFYREYKKTVPDKNGGEKEEAFFVMRSHSVFNVEQVESDQLDDFRVGKVLTDPTIPDARYDDADEVIAATDADIRFGGNRACYYCEADYIQMPHRHQFGSGGQYYETLFHELCHWSEKRRQWEGSYELGELIAEIAACYLSAELRLPHGENMDSHAAYLKSWLCAMKGDPSFIFKASSQASQAADYILSFSRMAVAAQSDITVD